jgi:hypothetical protein
LVLRVIWAVRAMYLFSPFLRRTHALFHKVLQKMCEVLAHDVIDGIEKQ